MVTRLLYEQEIDETRKQVPVVYSTDQGQTWTTQFVLESNSSIFGGSGIFQYPDIVYNAPNDLLFLGMVDPKANINYNNLCFISGDIANADSVLRYPIGCGADGFVYNACACTNNFFLAVWTENSHCIYPQYFKTYWCTYPDFDSPPNIMHNFNYDQNTVFRSAPAAELEMASNVNQLFIVCETHLDSGTQITIKTNVMDEALISSGEQLNNLDLYNDPELMPGEYLGLGTDPDVSGCGNKVCVVYVEEGNVICKSSTTSVVYDPGFTWHTSLVDTNASTPVVYMEGNNVYCAYVKGGNLYLKISENAGLTWGTLEQKNDVDGTVVAEKGAVAICSGGIAFTDTRNGNYDIYYASYKTRPTPELSITGLIPLKMTIKNTGDALAYNVSYSITVKGRFIFLGRSISGLVIRSLEPSEEITVGKQRLLLGFGSIAVIGIAWADNAPLVSEKLTGKLVLFFFDPD